MLQTFRYRNSRGETGNYSVFVLSETPRYLMGIDFLSELKRETTRKDPDYKKSTEHPYSKWVDNWFTTEDSRIIEYNLISLIASCKMPSEGSFFAYHLDDDAAKKISTDISVEDVVKLVEAGEKFDLSSEDDLRKVPALAAAIEDYDNLMGVLLLREPTQYKDLKESRASEKARIKGLDERWMEAFKLFKKENIQEGSNAAE